MTSRRSRSKKALIVLALVVGALSGALPLLSPRPDSGSASTQNPPGRGLEPAWWESIAVGSVGSETTPDQRPRTTYRIPADVLFETDSAVIDQSGRANLLALATGKLAKALAITIAGATDSRGTRKHNMRLSAARAEAAKAVLTAAGIDEAIITTVAWADGHPIADENGPDRSTAQALNRRIEIIFTE